MASLPCYLNIYSKSGTFIATVPDFDLNNGQYPTVAQFLATSECVNNGITEISISSGGSPLPHSTVINFYTGLEDDGANLKCYDATPEIAEIITGFFLDGQEYVLGGSGGGEWGTITGTLSDQTDLNTALNAKANDSDVVKTSGTQTINGQKIFGTSPIVPSKTSAATNTGTAVATEAQVYAKQDKLTAQTVYTSKGSATKVPQITTNTLGQVTGITEVTITQPDISGKANTSDVLTKTNTTAFTPTGDYQPATKKYVDDSIIEYNAGEGISIGEGQICTEESDRKGLSPSGFHIPSADEWNGLNTIMTSLSITTGNDWKINLHMPFAGNRHYSDTSITFQGGCGYYWSSSPNSASSNHARNLNLESSRVYADKDIIRACGSSIRCFKNSYTTPNSSWTVIKGTLGSAGIFWDQSEGLISITDGTTGYTMMDKNLGATTVYNDGDTLTQANMGNMYQWGNNYGFPSTGTISKTSSAQVDASTYGPTNPYSSDTFITGNVDWSSVTNDDLWGDTSNSTHQECITIDNTITNTGVLSVNGQTGDVTVTDNTSFGATWNGVTDKSPSMDAVYDVLQGVETLLAAI